MFNNLQADQYYQDIFEIDLDLLKKDGINGLIIDIDNTIVPWSEEAIVIEVVDWFKELSGRGFKICLVSNGANKRVHFFAEELKIPAVGQAVKPFKKAFKSAQKTLNLKPKEIAVIGDQVFTDVFGGNRMGFTTILVDPMSDKELFTTKIMRTIEKFVKGRGKYDK